MDGWLAAAIPCYSLCPQVIQVQRASVLTKPLVVVPTIEMLLGCDGPIANARERSFGEAWRPSLWASLCRSKLMPSTGSGGRATSKRWQLSSSDYALAPSSLWAAVHGDDG